jgi:hypothetical protein
MMLAVEPAHSSYTFGPSASTVRDIGSKGLGGLFQGFNTRVPWPSRLSNCEVLLVKTSGFREVSYATQAGFGSQGWPGRAPGARTLRQMPSKPGYPPTWVPTVHMRATPNHLTKHGHRPLGSRIDPAPCSRTVHHTKTHRDKLHFPSTRLQPQSQRLPNLLHRLTTRDRQDGLLRQLVSATRPDPARRREKKLRAGSSLSLQLSQLPASSFQLCPAPPGRATSLSVVAPLEVHKANMSPCVAAASSTWWLPSS